MALIKQLFIDPGYYLPAITAKPSYRLIGSPVYLGVELELENCKFPLPAHGGINEVGPVRLQHGIKAHQDGSLRNGGIELVTKPIAGADVVTQVEYICQIANEQGWQASNRAGLHVHVDVQCLTPEQWTNLLKTYVLVEPCFFHAIGKERAGSIYCKSWYQYANIQDIRSTIASVNKGEWNSVPSRYLGLNINSTGKYGTLEFRHKNSTTNAQEIIDWINVIARWYQYGVSANLTPEVVTSLTPESIVTQVFGDTKLMDAEFPSYYYHACLPLWFELFDTRPAPTTTRKWERTERVTHKGYDTFMSKHKPAKPKPAKRRYELPPLEEMITINTAHAIPPANPQFPTDEDGVPYTFELFNGALVRTYHDYPQFRADRLRTPNKPFTHTTAEGMRYTSATSLGRNDLYFRIRRPNETNEPLPHGAKFVYAIHIPEIV